MNRYTYFLSCILLVACTLFSIDLQAQSKDNIEDKVFVDHALAKEAVAHFKKLVLNKDVEGLHFFFYGGLHEKEFIDHAVKNLTSNTALRSRVLKLKEKHIQYQPNVPTFIEEIKSFPGLCYVEIYTKRRRGMDSIDGFYFAKVDGVYRLVYYLIAG